ncbi:MAG: ATP-binding protein [Flavobacteriales bacterium]|nr:ATP-binding protein [Flavobacteriales bacterium]
MKTPKNPFLLMGYAGPEYFCNREKEVENLTEAYRNNRNVTLYSPRRLGKTGLIQHFFSETQKTDSKVITIYVDILDTVDLEGFINLISSAVLNATETKADGFIKRMTELFSGMKASFLLNEYTGMPEVQLGLGTTPEKEHSLAAIMNHLENSTTPVVVAIDEFQQISNYPEKNVEALLRKYIQQQQNVNYIFSGSEKHLLLPMFSDAKRPFYQSTQHIHLKKLEFDTYKSFIQKHLNEGNKNVPEIVLDYILNWTDIHTFYTQYVCNTLYALQEEEIALGRVKKLLFEILTEKEGYFHTLTKLLSKHQLQVLAAVAKENVLTEPTAQKFLRKHELSGAATVRKSLQALVSKGLVDEELSDEKPEYRVNDVFLRRWLEMR